MNYANAERTRRNSLRESVSRVRTANTKEFRIALIKILFDDKVNKRSTRNNFHDLKNNFKSTPLVS
jgi:hypothetical protein